MVYPFLSGVCRSLCLPSLEKPVQLGAREKETQEASLASGRWETSENASFVRKEEGTSDLERARGSDRLII